MGVFRCSPSPVCANSIFDVVGAGSLHFIVVAMACSAGSVAEANDESDSWRLIDFSVNPETAVFSDPQGVLERFEVSDPIADGLWLIDSIAADHVVMQSVERDQQSSAGAGIVLRRGERLPDPADFEPETSFYYQIHGMVVEELDSEAVYPDGEDG